jgi:hypothetical protein
MKTLKDFINENIYEKLDNPVKYGDLLLDSSNGTITLYSRNNLKFLDVPAIENDYKSIDKKCKLIAFKPSNNGFNEVDRKLVCIIMSEVKYQKDTKKMEQEMLAVAQRYSNVDIYKIKSGELSNRYHDMKGNIHFDIYFNRVATIGFTFHPKGYTEPAYKTTLDGGTLNIRYDEYED